MQKVYARDAEGHEKLLALVRKEERTAYVCPIEKFDPSNTDLSLEFAVGFPIADVREVRSAPKS
mgnify:CR=1 FL=1